MKLAHLLRHTRQDHRVSQLDLAHSLGVSQRHVSYLESGRARPSRALLLAWMREVQAPASVRNAALLHAGFSLPQEELRLDSAEMAPALQALKRMLEAHDPNPALVFDADWNTVVQNRGARWLSSIVMPGLWVDSDDRGGRGLDMITAIGHPNGLLSRMREPWMVGAALLAQLRTESWARPSLQPRIDRLAQELERGYRTTATSAKRIANTPYLSLTFDTEFGPLSYFTIQSVFALPQDVTLASIRMELWFPADDATSRVMRENVPRPP
jgi:transcriptional regulator with XRE-family HTH domain